MDHQKTLEEVARWATSDDNIRAVIVTGSVARGPSEMNALSDIDLELYAIEPSTLLESSTWYEAFGDVLVVEKMPNPGWFPTRLVNYADGKIDFMIAPTSALKTVRHTRPFRILLDKDGLAGHLEIAHSPAKPAPSEESFIQCVNWFYAETFMCAKCLVREELWMAKFRECSFMTELLKMIEWDHLGRHGPTFDTWYLGTHWREWMDTDIRDALTGCWSHFDAPDSARALKHTIQLFSELAIRTASSFQFAGFEYERASFQVERYLAQSEEYPTP